MHDAEIAEVDIYGSAALKERVAALVATELGADQSADMILRTINLGSGTTKVLGTFVGGELVSMNAFMLTRFEGPTGQVLGYQSGYSATDGNHRGKGYWPKLLAYAEDYLAGIGGSFIFGFPNPVSHPLFIKKLHYQQTQLFNLRIPCFPFVFGRAFRDAQETQSQAVLQPAMDDYIGWKKQTQENGQVVVSTHGGSTLWGKRRQARKYGIPVDFLEVGTMSLGRRTDLRPLLRQAAHDARVRFIYISMNPENEYFDLLKFRQEGQPVIIKGIGGFDPADIPVNYFGGMRDTF